MANRYWRGGSGTWNTTSTTNWSATDGGAGGASVPTTADDVFITSLSGSPTITLTGALNCKSLTTTGATCTLTSTGTMTVAGGMTLSATTTWSATGAFTFTTTGTLTTNGVLIQSPITLNGTSQTFTLGGNLTSNKAFTYSAGNLTLSNNTLSVLTFTSNVSVARVIAFGTGNITITGSGSYFTVNGSGVSYTGTPTINLNNNSATASSLNVSTGFTETNSFIFNVTTGTYAFSSFASNAYKSLNFTGFAGSWNPGLQTNTFYGDLILSSGISLTPGSATFVFAHTSGTATVTSAGRALPNVTVNCPGAIFSIGDAFSSSGTFTLTSGTVQLNTFTLSTLNFTSNNTNSRVINFGTGNIRVTASGGSTNISATNLTYTGTPTFNISNSGSVATSATFSNFSESNAFNVNITAGTYAFTASNGIFKNLNFTGFAGSFAASARTIYGNLTLSTGMTVTAGAGVTTFAATSGTQVITSNGKTIDVAITVSGTAPIQLADAFSQGTTRTFTASNTSIIDINSQTNTFGALSLSGHPTITNGTLNATTTTVASGTLIVPSPATIVTSGSFALSTFTLDLATNNATLTAGSFTTSTGTIAFGSSGQLTLTGNNVTVYNATTPTFTGTVKIVSNYNGSVGTRTFAMGTMTAANVINVSANPVTGLSFGTSGTDIVTVRGNVKAFDLTGFSGTYTSSTSGITIYGDFTVPSSVTIASSTGVVEMATSESGANYIVTTNGKSLDFPFRLSSTGGVGSVTLSDDLTLSSTKIFSILGGTFNANSKNVTASIVVSTGTTSRTINMGSGTWTLTSGSGVVWSTDATNLTVNAGTSTIVLLNNILASTTFECAGATYNNLVIGGGGSGTGSILNIADSGTFNTISSTKTVAHTITVTAGTTITVSNWAVSGSPSNVVTLNSSVAGSQFTLTKTGSGIISGIDYLSIKDSAATPSTLTWYAGANSTNAGNNTGWIFGTPGSSSNFFLLF